MFEATVKLIHQADEKQYRLHLLYKGYLFTLKIVIYILLNGKKMYKAIHEYVCGCLSQFGLL